MYNNMSFSLCKISPSSHFTSLIILRLQFRFPKLKKYFVGCSPCSIHLAFNHCGIDTRHTEGECSGLIKLSLYFPQYKTEHTHIHKITPAWNKQFVVMALLVASLLSIDLHFKIILAPWKMIITQHKIVKWLREIKRSCKYRVSK